MTSFYIPVIEWGGAISWFERGDLRITCFCLDDLNNELILGFNNGSLYKISSGKGIIFISASLNLRYPIDHILRITADLESEDPFENTEAVYFAVNRAGNVMLFDAADGRCLLFNELHFDMIFSVQASNDLAWVLQDDGLLSVVSIPTVKLLASNQINLIGGQILTCRLARNELVVLFKEPNETVIKSICKYDAHNKLISISYENVEAPTEGIIGAFFETGDVLDFTFWNDRKLFYRDGLLDFDHENDLYLGQGVIAKSADGDYFKLNRDDFAFPRRTGYYHFSNNWILCREHCTTLKAKHITTLRERTFQMKFPEISSNALCKSLLDLHTFTIYKGYSDGSLRRFIYSDLFNSKESGVKFETNKHQAAESPINFIHNSRVTGKIWTGHENGDLSQWDPITRCLVCIVKTAHSFPIIQMIESPEEWGGPKCALSIDQEGSLCLCTNDECPMFVSDLPLEYGKLRCIAWMSPGQIIPIEQNFTGKIWKVERNAGCECNLIGSISSQQQQNEVEEYLKAARHIDYPITVLKKKQPIAHGLTSVLHVVDNQDWAVPFGQLYMLDMRKILEGKLSSEIGKEEEQKLTSSLIKNCLNNNEFGIGILG